MGGRARAREKRPTHRVVALSIIFLSLPLPLLSMCSLFRSTVLSESGAINASSRIWREKSSVRFIGDA